MKRIKSYVLALGISMLFILNQSCNNMPIKKTHDSATMKFDASMTQKSIYRLSDFTLCPSLSADALIRQVGKPDHYSGSGVTWLVYKLIDDEELWLLFLPQPGFTKLSKAIVRQLNGQIEKIVYP